MGYTGKEFIIFCNGRHFTARWRESPYAPLQLITLDGSEQMTWSADNWNTIFLNLSLDWETEAYRFCVFSDTEMTDTVLAALPSGKREQMSLWTQSELSQLAREQGPKASEWIINDVSLGPAMGKTFPTVPGKPSCHIYTVPVFELVVSESGKGVVEQMKRMYDENFRP